MPTSEINSPGNILDVVNVSKSYRLRTGELHHAVKDASFTISERETLALVGESGSGKTTLTRISLGLLKPDVGEVMLLDRSIYRLGPRQLRAHRTAMQPVFQDSGAAFNPRRTIRQLIGQALPVVDRPNAAALTIELLEQVKLHPANRYLDRFPHELSGGQRQRLAIARALAAQPRLVIADEPLSGADVSVRGQVLNLLMDLQEKSGLSYLFVTHDISIAKAFAHRVIVMYRGEIVEAGSAHQVLTDPSHEYTRRLVSAVPSLENLPVAKRA